MSILPHFTEKEIQKFHDWHTQLKSKKGIKNQYNKTKETERFIWAKENPCPLKDKIEIFYNSGYGYKIIARELNISYTVARKLFKRYLGISIRTGYNVVTDRLKEQRSVNATGEKSNWFDWTNRKPWMQEKTTRSIQGYYKKKTGDYVWLRSTYEYIYAKWLDSRDINWKVEVNSFKLKNGENYRPDFFIYNEKDILESIVEIKSSYYIENHNYKFLMFKKEYPEIESAIIYNIEKFTKESYAKEIKKWKQERLLKEELEKLK